MSKVYLIYPNTNPPFNMSYWHNYVSSMHNKGYIQAWWHYIPGGLYFVQSNLGVDQLSKLVKEHYPNGHFIVMEVNPKNQQGWLPTEGWAWFKSFRD